MFFRPTYQQIVAPVWIVRWPVMGPRKLTIQFWKDNFYRRINVQVRGYGLAQDCISYTQAREGEKVHLGLVKFIAFWWRDIRKNNTSSLIRNTHSHISWATFQVPGGLFFRRRNISQQISMYYLRFAAVVSFFPLLGCNDIIQTKAGKLDNSFYKTGR